MQLISNNLAFHDDNFRTLMIECTDYDKFFLQFDYDTTQKESTLTLNRENRSNLIRNEEVVVERCEGTGFHYQTLRFTDDNKNRTSETYKQANPNVCF